MHETGSDHKAFCFFFIINSNEWNTNNDSLPFIICIQNQQFKDLSGDFNGIDFYNFAEKIQNNTKVMLLCFFLFHALSVHVGLVGRAEFGYACPRSSGLWKW